MAALALPAAAAAAPVPLAQVGSAGADAGQLNGPEGVALDGSGNLYVAERDNHRISVFSAAGSFTHAFGFGVDTGAAAFEVCTTASGCQTGIDGGGAGQLHSPRGVAVDGSGSLYVADVNNNRISVFSTAAPSFTRAFGRGVGAGATAFEVCTTASGCQPGIPGVGAGEFTAPLGVALDGSGNLYVADVNSSRISVFSTAAPSFTHAFGFGVDTGAAAFEVCTTASGCGGGIDGGGAGQLAGPTSVALDGSGNLYVADGDNSRIDVFSAAAPSFIRAFGFGVGAGGATSQVCTTASGCQAGIFGPGAGQLDLPVGVAADGSGSLYVAERNNERISVFSAAGSFTHAFGFGVDTGAAAFEVCTTASGCGLGIDGGGAGQFDAPLGVAVDCRGAAWVADANNGRLQRFGEPGTALPPCPPPPNGGGPPPPNGGGPPPPNGGGPPPADTSAPDGDVKAKGSQKAGKAIKVNVGSNEAGTASATGKVIVRGARKALPLSALAAKKKKKATFKLKPASKEIAAGATVTLKLKPKGKKNKRKLVKLVKGGAKAKAKIKWTLTDLAGNSTSGKLVVKLKK